MYVCIILNFIYLFIYLFLAVLDLRFCARAFPSCGKRGPLFIAVRRHPTIAASLVAEHRLQSRRLSSCGSRAQVLRGTWDPPRPGLEPASPALAGRFSTTAPPGKPETGHSWSQSQSSLGRFRILKRVHADQRGTLMSQQHGCFLCNCMLGLKGSNQKGEVTVSHRYPLAIVLIFLFCKSKK